MDVRSQPNPIKAAVETEAMKSDLRKKFARIDLLLRCDQNTPVNGHTFLILIFWLETELRLLFPITGLERKTGETLQEICSVDAATLSRDSLNTN